MANLILATVPNGFWEKIIFAFNGAVKNYAFAIILITICIKLVLLPLDYLNKRSTIKMNELNAKIQPKIAEIQKRYPDKNIQNQKINELYKKEKINPLGSCLPMLAGFVLQLVVFITLFSGLNSMSAYKITNQYEKLQVAYITEYAQKVDSLTSEEIEELTSVEIDNYIIKISTKLETESEEEYQERLTKAQSSANKKYKDVKDSFLWIKNVWIADSAFKKSIPSFESYLGTSKIKLKDDEKENAKIAYNYVMGSLSSSSKGVNGYFILALLAAASTYFSQYLATRKQKKKENFYTQNQKPTEQQKAQEGSAKVMMVVLPVIMAIFALSNNSIFSLYIVTSQLVSMVTTPLVNKLVSLSDKKKETK